MPRVRFASPFRCAPVLTAGWLLSGCLASAPPSGGPVNTVSSRQLASDLRLAAPPPALADKALPEPTFDDLDPPAAGGRLASHAAVSERIGPARSPRLAMAVVQDRFASAPAVAAAAPQVAAPVQSPSPSPPFDTEVGAGIRAGQCWAQLVKQQAQTVKPGTAAVRVTQHEGLPQLVWRRALCESVAVPEVVNALQLALRKQGMDVGPADGKLGRRTMAALVDFQRREGLAMGLVTFETLAKLGVALPQP